MQFNAITMNLTKDFLQTLFNHIKGHDISFEEEGPGVMLRHDVDDNLQRSFSIARMEADHGISSTFFILNTAPYWSTIKRELLFDTLREMQEMGHRIHWHNNALASWVKFGGTESLRTLIGGPIELMREEGLNVTGSASHGDALCRKFGFINYEIFSECKRTREATNFPQPNIKMPIGTVSMKDFGLNYETYHVPYDRYYSESGGQFSNTPVPTPEEIGEINDRVQILIHPQWWPI